MGRWRRVWLHLRGKKEEVEQPKGAQQQGLQSKSPTTEPIITPTSKFAEPFSPAELDRQETIEKSGQTRVDVIDSIKRCSLSNSLPNFALAKLMLRQIFIVNDLLRQESDPLSPEQLSMGVSAIEDKKNQPLDSWFLYQKTLLEVKEKKLEAIDAEYKRELAELKKRFTHNVPKEHKKEAYREYIRKKDATNTYFEGYLEVVGGKIQGIGSESIKYESVLTGLKHTLRNKTQEKFAMEEILKNRLKAQNELITSSITAIEKVKSAMDGILTLKKMFQAAGIVASYVVAAAGAKLAVTSQQFKQFFLDLTARLPSLERAFGPDLIYAKLVAGIATFLGLGGITSKLIENYFKRKVNREETEKLTKQSDRINEGLSKLWAVIATTKEEREQMITIKINSLNEKIHELHVRYAIAMDPENIDRTLERAVFKYRKDIQSYLKQRHSEDPRERDNAEDILYPVIFHIVKKLRGKLNYKVARERLFNKLNDLTRGQ